VESYVLPDPSQGRVGMGARALRATHHPAGSMWEPTPTADVDRHFMAMETPITPQQRAHHAPMDYRSEG